MAGHESLSKIHDILIQMDRYHPSYWVQAMSIVRRVHRLPEGHFKLLDSSFPLPLEALEVTLARLSPTDLEIDFGYLTSFS